MEMELTHFFTKMYLYSFAVLRKCNRGGIITV